MSNNYIVYDGTAGNYASAPDHASYDFASDFDLRWKGMLDDWGATGDNQHLFGRWDGGTNGFLFRTANHASRFISLLLRDDRPGNQTATSDAGVPAAFNGWVRVTYDSSEGDVKFYTSTDGTSWAQLGTTQSLIASPMLANSSAVSIGQRSTGDDDSAGRVERVQMYDGIDGTLVFDANFEALTAAEVTAKAFTAGGSTAATVTLNGAAWTFERGQTWLPPDSHTAIATMLSSSLETELLGYLVEEGSLGTTDVVGALNAINGTTDVDFEEAYTYWLKDHKTTEGPGA